MVKFVSLGKAFNNIYIKNHHNIYTHTQKNDVVGMLGHKMALFIIFVKVAFSTIFPSAISQRKPKATHVFLRSIGQYETSHHR